VPLLGYCEYHYHANGADVGFDSEFSSPADIAHILRLRNAVNLLSLDAMDRGLTPTPWQHSLYPNQYRDRISVIHEGIDTDTIRPDAGAQVWLRSGLSLRHGDPVITYVARSLEPYRGFHVFMRALPELLRRVPRAQILIIGDDSVSYGVQPDENTTWRARMLEELGGRLDQSRVHFLGQVSFEQYLSILQVSAVHVYLTYPFVLSWSLMEALAAGCCVVASDTAPIRDVIADGENGLLVDFFDAPALAARIAGALHDRSASGRMGALARDTIRQQYDLHRVSLPAQHLLLRQMTGNSLGKLERPRLGRTVTSGFQPPPTDRRLGQEGRQHGLYAAL